MIYPNQQKLSAKELFAAAKKNAPPIMGRGDGKTSPNLLFGSLDDGSKSRVYINGAAACLSYLVRKPS